MTILPERLGGISLRVPGRLERRVRSATRPEVVERAAVREPEPARSPILPGPFRLVDARFPTPPGRAAVVRPNGPRLDAIQHSRLGRGRP